MTKKDVIAKSQEKLAGREIKVSKDIVDTIYEVVQEVVVEGLEAGEDVPVAKLGKLTVVERAAREGRNPKTGEAMTIAACKVPKFKPSAGLKQIVKGQ